MRVLLVAQFYPPVIGGEERHVRNLAVALAARGLDVHVATLDVGGTPQQDPGVTVHLVDNLGRRAPRLYPTADRPLALPLPDPLSVRSLARVLDEVRPDVVHAHNWLVNSLLALPAAHRLPVVCSLHDYSHVCATKRSMFEGAPCSGPGPGKCFDCARDHYGTLRGPVIQAAVRGGIPVRLRGVDVFTPVSSYVARANLLEEQGAHWQVVPNFVPDDLTRLPTLPRDPALPEGDYVFFAGDLSPQKGVVTLVEAWRRLPWDRPDLVLVGRPSMDLDALLGPEATRRADGVHVHHHWEHERVLSGFQHALAAALPSEWPDPCPTTVLEAMAVGAPLVTTHQGGIADMVEPDVAGLVVPPGDPQALSAALARLIAEPGLRERLVAGASVQVGSFLQGRVAEDLETLYRGLAQGQENR